MTVLVQLARSRVCSHLSSGLSFAYYFCAAFAEVMSFAGLIPEVTNGRAAMVAMLAAFGAELGTHQPVPVQIQKAPLLIVGTFVLIIAGSLAPIIRNANLDRNGFGPFNQRAEIWNGRLAMVAFTLLLLVETFRDGPALVP